MYLEMNGFASAWRGSVSRQNARMGHGAWGICGWGVIREKGPDICKSQFPMIGKISMSHSVRDWILPVSFAD